jgi:RNA polymerase-binding transcription factor DksA
MAISEVRNSKWPSGSWHLSAPELAQLYQQLVGELQAHADQAREQERKVAALQAEPGDALGPLEVVRDVAEVVVAWSHEAIVEIATALARMADGSYGKCSHCTAPIRFERLVAIPHARYCVTCQTIRGASHYGRRANHASQG